MVDVQQRAGPHDLDSTQHTGTVPMDAWITASSLKGTATNGAGDGDKLPQSREGAANQVNYDYMAFDATTSEHAFFQWTFPGGWDEGTITFSLRWTNTSGLSTETIDFDLKAVALTNDDALNASWGTAVNVTDTFLAQDDVHITAESAALTIGGTPADGDFVIFDLSRDVAADNLTGDCDVLGIRLILTRDNIGD